MSFILLCLYLFCENHFILFISGNIILYCWYLFCVAAVLLSCCFRAMKMSNHHLRLSSGSTTSEQTSRWSYGHPTSFAAAIQLALDKLLVSLPLHRFERAMATWTELHFWWVCTFFVQLSTLQNWCTLTRETSCAQQPPAPLCGSSCKHPPSIALLVIFFAWPFHWLKCVFNVSLFRDTWLDNCTVFLVSCQTVYYENANAIPSSSPINLLLLLPQSNKHHESVLTSWPCCFMFKYT